MKVLCMLPQSLSYMSFDQADLDGLVFLGVLHPLWLLYSFCLLFHKVAQVLSGTRESVEPHHFRLIVPWSLSAYCLVMDPTSSASLIMVEQGNDLGS